MESRTLPRPMLQDIGGITYIVAGHFADRRDRVEGYALMEVVPNYQRTLLFLELPTHLLHRDNDEAQRAVNETMPSARVHRVWFAGCNPPTTAEMRTEYRQYEPLLGRDMKQTFAHKLRVHRVAARLVAERDLQADAPSVNEVECTILGERFLHRRADESLWIPSGAGRDDHQSRNRRMRMVSGGSSCRILGSSDFDKKTDNRDDIHTAVNSANEALEEARLSYEKTDMSRNSKRRDSSKTMPLNHPTEPRPAKRRSLRDLGDDSDDHSLQSSAKRTRQKAHCVKDEGLNNSTTRESGEMSTNTGQPLPLSSSQKLEFLRIVNRMLTLANGVEPYETVSWNNLDSMLNTKMTDTPFTKNELILRLAAELEKNIATGGR